jgi:hypothetical protein
MKQRDIKPDTAYATCDGNLVVSSKTDATKTHWLVSKDGKHAVTDTDPRTAESDDDPWGRCRTGSRRVNALAKGVRVTQFDYDDDGKRIGTGHETVIPAKDIPGTWVDYMTLHADRVRTRVLVREAQKAAVEQARKINADLNTALAPEKGATDEWAGTKVPIYVGVHPVHKVYRPGKGEMHTSRVDLNIDRVIETTYVTRVEFFGEVADRVANQLTKD